VAENQSTDSGTDDLSTFEAENIARGMMLTEMHLTDEERAEATGVEVYAEMPVSAHHVVLRSAHGKSSVLFTLPHMSILTDALDALVACGDVTRELDGIAVVGGDLESEEDDLTDLRVPVYAFSSEISFAETHRVGMGDVRAASPEEQLLAAIFGGTPEDYADAIVTASTIFADDENEAAPTISNGGEISKA
jgi:hypothetical protein